MRDTRIRLFDGNLVFVPNALAPTSVIENISRRPSFRVVFSLHVPHGTVLEELDRAVELIRDAVRAEPGTDEAVQVHLLEPAKGVLEIKVLYFINDTSRLLDIRHAINRRICVALDDTGISLAHPALTLQTA